jgi:hypothetical protein
MQGINMDILFLCGAVVIGARNRFWVGAGVALLQLAALAGVVVGEASRRPTLAIPAALVYVASAGAALALYVGGTKLPRDHARRETCELLGAAAIVALLPVVALTAIVLVHHFA